MKKRKEEKTIPVIAVPRVLREKLGEDGVDSLFELFNKSEQKVKEDVITLSEEKFTKKLSEEISGLMSDMAILEGRLEARISGGRADTKEEFASFRAEVKEEFASFRAEVKEEFALVRTEFKEEIASVRTEFKEEIASVRAEFKEEIASVRTEFKEEIAKIRVEMTQFKSEIIKWMFLFWIGQLACMAGIVNWLR